MRQLVRAIRIKIVPQVPDTTVQPNNNDYSNNDGILAAPSLAAVVTNVRDAAALKHLGEGVASIPPMEMPAGNSADPLAAFSLCAERYAADERQQIASLYGARERAKAQLDLLQNWKAFVLMVHEQAARLAEDACGYDERLAWSDAQFCAWRASAAGQAAVAAGTLAAATALTAAPAEPGRGLDGAQAAEAAEGPCQKRRCERHKGWRTQKLQEIRFEQSLAKADIDRLSREALEIMYRANIRQISKANNGGMEGVVEEIVG
jgi:COMPASS component SPP1